MFSFRLKTHIHVLDPNNATSALQLPIHVCVESLFNVFTFRNVHIMYNIKECYSHSLSFFSFFSLCPIRFAFILLRCLSFSHFILSLAFALLCNFARQFRWLSFFFLSALNKVGSSGINISKYQHRLWIFKLLALITIILLLLFCCLHPAWAL